MRNKGQKKNYRRLCPQCDRWHTETEGCNEQDMQNRRLNDFLQDVPGKQGQGELVFILGS